MKVHLLTLILVALFAFQGMAQHTYTWEETGVVMDFHFNPADAEFEDEDGELTIYLDELEMEFLALNKDSVMLYFNNPYIDLIHALVDEFEVIILSTPDSFPNLNEGVYMLAMDTVLFTDSLLLGAFSHPLSPLIILAVFDCYNSPFAEALAIMRSIRFDEGLIRQD